ncbi:hypothetical protein [Spirosoma endbachense]|uniref:Uncharacterized protein n=1 Tax=Spirosoma endbachense TaxID=2666025 RepID=A0A6P1VWS2_9BACT|nr:hypothetical protein [Spirosoma endbachense]QHV96280.1 hypothetical protein GJR95_15205 [Spirosoma endbachense]
MASGSGSYKSINKNRAQLKAQGGSAASGRTPKYKPLGKGEGANKDVPF